MSERMKQLLAEVRALENAVEAELYDFSKKATYTVKQGKVHFAKEVTEVHRSLRLNIAKFLFESNFLYFLTAPIIYSMIIPAMILDIFCCFYQSVCFPVYKIPKVVRRDYIRFDRSKLAYLNGIEKINCEFCAYFNGTISFAREVASRTEQYWCPIRHALRIKGEHFRAKNFIQYGDAKNYHQRLEKLRREVQSEIESQ